jgi:CHASE2 domain-containing sensor protein
MKKSTGYQCKQDIINAQAKEIARLQDRLNAAEEVIANAVGLIGAQQDKIAILEAKLNAKEQARVTANKASDNNDKLVRPNRYGYSVKDMIAKSIAYEEAQKASKRIVNC